MASLGLVALVSAARGWDRNAAVPTTPGERLLMLTMIVKVRPPVPGPTGRHPPPLKAAAQDEATSIEAVLRSALPHVDEWFIMDTGSTDGTQRIIRETVQRPPAGHRTAACVLTARRRRSSTSPAASRRAPLSTLRPPGMHAPRLPPPPPCRGAPE